MTAIHLEPNRCGWLVTVARSQLHITFVKQLEQGGKALPVETRTVQRVWWDLGIKGTTKSRVTLEWRSDDVVDVELRLEINGTVKADVVRFVDPKTNAVLGKVELQAATGGGFVSGTRLALPKGASVRPELASGARGPVLTP